MGNAKRDDNYVPALLAESNAGNGATVVLWADPTTHRLLVDVSGGAGTSATDDSAFTAATDSGTPIMGFVTSDSVDAGDVGVLAMLANRQLKVSVYDSSGNEVTSFGAGTQYTEDAAAAANPVGNALIVVREDARAGGLTSTDGDNVALRGSNAGELYTVDANTGAIKTAVEIMDDWDESDRAKVNLIVGQAGITAGAGAVGANTPRVTLASDDPAVVALQIIDNPVLVDDAAFTPATSSVMMVGFEYDDTAPDSVNEGDAGAARMSARREIYVQLRDAAGNERGANVNASGEVLVALSSVPSHAVTNAGTFAVQVDGAALTALQKIDDPVLVDDAAFTPATSSVMMMGAEYDDTATDSVDEGDAGAVRMSANRNLYVRIRDNAGNERGMNVDANGDIGVTARSGAFASGSIASGAIASGAIASGAIAAGAIAAGNTSIATTEDTARAAGEHLVKVGLVRLDTPVANANVSTDGDYTTFIADNFGKQWVSGTVPEDTAHVAGEALTVLGARRIDTPATSAGTSGDWATVDASAEGALWATLTPTTTGGLTIFRSIDLDETEEEVKATAGSIYGIWFSNMATSTRFLKLYNATAANVIVGTTTPVITLALPGNTSDDISGALNNGGLGIGFGTAICAAATTGIADADTGAPGANEVIVNIFYK